MPDKKKDQAGTDAPPSSKTKAPHWKDKIERKSRAIDKELGFDEVNAENAKDWLNTRIGLIVQENQHRADTSWTQLQAGLDFQRKMSRGVLPCSTETPPPAASFEAKSSRQATTRVTVPRASLEHNKSSDTYRATKAVEAYVPGNPNSHLPEDFEESNVRGTAMSIGDMNNTNKATPLVEYEPPQAYPTPAKPQKRRPSKSLSPEKQHKRRPPTMPSPITQASNDKDEDDDEDHEHGIEDGDQDAADIQSACRRRQQTTTKRSRANPLETNLGPNWDFHLVDGSRPTKARGNGHI
ncbi:hypothetical protein PG996_003906 [Apiospora saccharicola]|uniref:Uncharacterized protein n=1 Tax=Apiospora saccharicola TaxID=335842 RepID=A0ABR1W5B5_9PEZI